MDTVPRQLPHELWFGIVAAVQDADTLLALFWTSSTLRAAVLRRAHLARSAIGSRRYGHGDPYVPKRVLTTLLLGANPLDVWDWIFRWGERYGAERVAAVASMWTAPEDATRGLWQASRTVAQVTQLCCSELFWRAAPLDVRSAAWDLVVATLNCGDLHAGRAEQAGACALACLPWFTREAPPDTQVHVAIGLVRARPADAHSASVARTLGALIDGSDRVACHVLPWLAIPDAPGDGIFTARRCATLARAVSCRVALLALDDAPVVHLALGLLDAAVRHDRARLRGATVHALVACALLVRNAPICHGAVAARMPLENTPPAPVGAERPAALPGRQTDTAVTAWTDLVRELFLANAGMRDQACLWLEPVAARVDAHKPARSFCRLLCEMATLGAPVGPAARAAARALSAQPCGRMACMLLGETGPPAVDVAA